MGLGVGVRTEPREPTLAPSTLEAWPPQPLCLRRCLPVLSWCVSEVAGWPWMSIWSRMTPKEVRPGEGERLSPQGREWGQRKTGLGSRPWGPRGTCSTPSIWDLWAAKGRTSQKIHVWLLSWAVAPACQALALLPQLLQESPAPEGGRWDWRLRRGPGPPAGQNACSDPRWRC